MGVAADLIQWRVFASIGLLIKVNEFASKSFNIRALSSKFHFVEMPYI